MLRRLFGGSYLFVLLLRARADEWNLPCGGESDGARLVVNSHASYGTAVSRLMNSLVSVGFRDFCRVVVVVGGSEADAAPRRVGNLTYAHLSVNAHDYSGLDALHVYRDDPLIRAPYYFYVHDTCIAHPRFVSFFKKELPSAFADGDGAPLLLLPPGLSSNIVALSARYVAVYGDHFHKNMTKKEALDMELGGALRALAGENNTRFTASERKFDGKYDVYHTGHEREMFYYPDFGVYKFILFGHHGDFQGMVTPNQ